MIVKQSGNTATFTEVKAMPIFDNDSCTVWKLSHKSQNVMCSFQNESKSFLVSSGFDLDDASVDCLSTTRTKNEKNSHSQPSVRLSSKRRVAWMPFASAEKQKSDCELILRLETSSIDPFPLDNKPDVYVVELKKTFVKVEQSKDPKNLSKDVEELEISSEVTSNVGTSLLHSNSYVNVWDFIIAPGKTCHLHRHMNNYFFLNIMKSETQGIDRNGEPMGPSSIQEAGQLTFVDLKGGDAIHASKNLGDADFRQIIVELKAIE